LALDDLVVAASDALPDFNKDLLIEYRKRQIHNCTKFMEKAFIEATKHVEGARFIGSKELSPEERLRLLSRGRHVPTIDINRSELKVVEFTLGYENQIFPIHLYLPYLIDNAIVVNGAKYFVQFALTDKVFYHIPKPEGLGIKLLVTHLRFWRNLQYTVSGLYGTYTNQIITTKIHQRQYKPTKEDILTALILYPICWYGWRKTLEIFDINPEDVEFVQHPNREDNTYEYICIREKDNDSIWMKTRPELLSEKDAESRTKARVIASILYVLTYFDKYPQTMFSDNKALISYLTDDPDNVVWKVILGKSIYGIDENERKAIGYSEHHLSSMTTYLDATTKVNLEASGVYVNDVMELIVYIFKNIDSHVVKRTPSDLSNKRINMIDLLLGSVVQKLFRRVFNYTNHKSGITGDASKIFRLPIKSFTALNKSGAILAINPSTYNDNALISVLAGKKRTTHSSGTISRKQGVNIQSTDHRYHPTWSVVESATSISIQHPDISGDINALACQIDDAGNIVIPDFAQAFISDMMDLIVTS
jgi:hypothetical protein